MLAACQSRTRHIPSSGHQKSPISDSAEKRARWQGVQEMAPVHHDKSGREMSENISLPVCRWRKKTAQGYVCHSTKLVNSPNVVSAAFCMSCPCADDEPPRGLPHALPCVHLGQLARGAAHDREH